MIRDYIESDLNDIIRIYTLEYIAMPEEIEALKSASKILVYDDEGVKGFIHLSVNGRYCAIEMGVQLKEDTKAIGLQLWQEAQKYFQEKSIDFIHVFHVKDDLEFQELFDELEFDYWYSVYRLRYQGERFPEVKIKALIYEDRYYDDKIRIESEAFSVIRERYDIKPYNWYLAASKEALAHNRKYTENNKQYIHLFFEGDEIVGASMVKDAEIELLFTNINYQKQGYGKKILEYTINKGLEQGSSEVFLNVLAGNENALNLYTDAGFAFVQAQDSRRLIRKQEVL